MRRRRTMGIDIDGGIIVGRQVDEIENVSDPLFDEDINEWLEKYNLTNMNPWFDCESDYWIVGFRLDDILVGDIDEKWVQDVKEKARKFKEITGTDAKLIGMQDVY
jgi:hypothetical protein